LKNAAELDVELQTAISRFDYTDLSHRFHQQQATMAPVNDVADFIADEHVESRENVISLHDEELGGPLRMQNVVGKLSRTPGTVTHCGPPLGAHNRSVLVNTLGYDPAVLEEAGINLEPPHTVTLAHQKG
jgi:formyl-CoA transferase